MKSSRILITVVVALSLTSEAVDARGRGGRASRTDDFYQMSGLNEEEETMWTLYYCVGGKWVARACGTDRDALEALAGKEKPTYSILNGPRARKTAISLFVTDPKIATGDISIIARFGSMDGEDCSNYQRRPR